MGVAVNLYLFSRPLLPEASRERVITMPSPLSGTRPVSYTHLHGVPVGGGAPVDVFQPCGEPRVVDQPIDLLNGVEVFLAFLLRPDVETKGAAGGTRLLDLPAEDPGNRGLRSGPDLPQVLSV